MKRKQFSRFGMMLALIIVLPNISLAFDDAELIDIPTASILLQANYSVNLRFEPEGAVLFRGAVGVRERLSIGVSYGGSNIIGEGEPTWNQDAKVNIKYKLIETGEQIFIPAVAIGYDSQGYGRFSKDQNRYERKSKGFFAVATKEVPIMPEIRIHAGANRSMEDDDENTEVDYFFGVDYSFGEEFLIMADYDMCLNEDVVSEKNEGNLNAGVRWFFAPELSLEFDFLNLLENNLENIERMAKIIYIGVF